MKNVIPLCLLIALFSCSSSSNSIIGKWYAINIDGDSIIKMDGKAQDSWIASLEFNKGGNAFYTIAGSITPYKWELSNDKISLTSSVTTETIEVIENKFLITKYENVPIILIKEGDNISLQELAVLIKRNTDKSQYLKLLQYYSDIK